MASSDHQSPKLVGDSGGHETVVGYLTVVRRPYFAQVDLRDNNSPINTSQRRQLFVMTVEEEGIAPHNPVQEEDEAMRAFAGAPGGVQDIDEEKNARLLKVIDRNLLPVRHSTIVVVFPGSQILILSASYYVLFMG